MLSMLRTNVRDALARRLGVPEIPTAMERLARQGLAPALVFDVGAYVGDFAMTCRRIWPSTRIACFEPQDRARAHVERMAEADGNVRVHAVLLGAEERAAVVLHEGETASSVLTEHAEPSHFDTVEHPMSTVDQTVAAAYDGRVPDLLKIDVQGYELEVLKGAEHSLSHMQAILAEVNLLDIHVGVPLLADLVGWLDARGFVAFDICGLTRRPLDDALWQADLVFVPKDSPLRRDKRWSA